MNPAIDQAVVKLPVVKLPKSPLSVSAEGCCMSAPTLSEMVANMVWVLSGPSTSARRFAEPWRDELIVTCSFIGAGGQTAGDAVV